MKLKTLIAATALVAISGSAMAAQPGEAVTGVKDITPMTAVIQFTGGIVENTCDVSINGNQALYGITTTSTTTAGATTTTTDITSPGSLTKDSEVYGDVVAVSLGFYTPTAAAGWTGGKADAQAVSVVLTNCPVSTIAWSVTGAEQGSTGYLKTSGKNGDAGTMGIEILEGTTNVLNVVPTTPQITISADGGGGTIDLTAGYVKIGTTALVQSNEEAFAAINFDYTF